MNELPPEKESDEERRRTNLVLLVFVVVMVGIGVWLVNALIDARNADECLTAGRCQRVSQKSKNAIGSDLRSRPLGCRFSPWSLG